MFHNLCEIHDWSFFYLFFFNYFFKVGISTDELDTIAHDLCIHYRAYPSPLNYRGYPKSICTSVNNVACHGIPDKRKLMNGDIISIDISVSIYIFYLSLVNIKLHSLLLKALFYVHVCLLHCLKSKMI